MSIILGLLLAAGDLPDLERGFLNARIKLSLEKERATGERSSDGASASRRLLNSDPKAIASLCSAAARSRDPRAFVETIGSSYRMSPAEKSQLVSKCMIFSEGLSEGRGLRSRR